MSINKTDSNQNLSNSSPMILKKKHNSDSNEKQLQSQPQQHSASTKTSPRKLFDPKENLRRISQAKSIDIECIVTDDDEDLTGILIAQRNNNYLSFDSEMLKNRPNSLRFRESNDYLANQYENKRLINPHQLELHHQHANSLEAKYLSNPILSNEKKKLFFKQSKDEKQNSVDQQAQFVDANKLDNNKPAEKTSTSSNNSVFFMSKTELNSDLQSKD